MEEATTLAYDDGPAIIPVEQVSGPGLVSILLGCTLFLLTLSAVTCLCYRRGRTKPRRPLAFSRRPTSALRSPAVNSYYIKKSPSPVSRPPSASPLGSGSNSPNDACIPSGSAGTSPTGDEGAQHLSEDASTKVHTEDETASIRMDSPTIDDAQTLDDTGSTLGQLVFRIRYKKEKSTLIVSVVKCRDLPGKDPAVGSSDPYVKLQLLPDKQHKVKTRVLRKTRNPVYDEDFTFYGITLAQLPNITLHFVVLSFDRYSRDDIIGEVFCSLDTVDLEKVENHHLSLAREIQPRSLKIKCQGRGELLLSLCWQPAANRLSIVVLKARNLPKMDVTGLADPYVKMYLMYNGQRISKKKTHVKKRTLNPVFNESFVFEIPPGAESLDHVSLEFLLLDWDRVTKNEVIGRLELGGTTAGSALHHWNEVRNSPRRQIAEWHKLRE